MTTPLGGTTGTTGAGAATTATKKPGESAMGPDAFMKLLVAQLKYQNPMAPADGQAYMTQMATFTQVEKLDQLVKAQADALQWQQRVSAEGMVGRSVTGTVDGVITSGTVTGVRYAGGSAVLELSDGRSLAPDAVERVHTVAPPAAAAAAAAPAAPATTPATTPAAAPAAPAAAPTTSTASTPSTPSA